MRDNLFCPRRKRTKGAGYQTIDDRATAAQIWSFPFRVFSQVFGHILEEGMVVFFQTIRITMHLLRTGYRDGGQKVFGASCRGQWCEGSMNRNKLEWLLYIQKVCPTVMATAMATQTSQKVVTSSTHTLFSFALGSYFVLIHSLTLIHIIYWTHYTYMLFVSNI